MRTLARERCAAGGGELGTQLQHRDELRQARRNCEPGNASACICVVSGHFEGAVERELHGGAETR